MLASIDPLVPLSAGEEPDPQALQVLRVQRTCVHDGPGIRTTVFFRGCGLRCAWCQNPESWDLRGSGGPSLRQVLDEIRRDLPFFQATGGGVTLSGGEPLLQPAGALVGFLEALREMGLHVAVETALHVPWDTVARVAPLVDLFLVDLKVVGDDALHLRLTSQGSSRIQANLRGLVETGARLVLRMVVVPGENDGPRELEAVARLLHSLKIPSVELLRYHEVHREKARHLGTPVERPATSPERSREALVAAAERLGALGLQVRADDLAPPAPRAAFSQRVLDIRDAIRASDYHLCLEASLLKTRFYRRHGMEEPPAVHRARRLAWILEHKRIQVWPGELLVGNFTAHRVGAQVWEEHFGIAWAVLLPGVEHQEPVAYRCSRRDRLAFFAEVLPFWAERGLLGRAFTTPGEMLLGLARSAEMNAGFNNNLAAIAHFVVPFEGILKQGTTGIRARIQASLARRPGNAFYQGALLALEGLERFAARYATLLARLAAREEDPVRRRELMDLSTVCARVPRHPARTFHEALQCMLFVQIGLCLESYENAVSLGRVDQVLYPYYQADREAGILTWDRARELLALFVLKLDECILASDGRSFLRISRLFETQSTDQTLTMGGMGRDGQDAVNDLTWMLLDICELQPLSVNMAARVHPGSSQAYLERIARVYLTGAPMPALYNDPVYVDALKRRYPTSVEDARSYAIVGCVEPNASLDHYGNTDCANVNLAMPFLQALRGEEGDLWRFGLLDQGLKLADRAVDYWLGEPPPQPSGGGGPAHPAAVASWKRFTRGLERVRRPPLRPPATLQELLARYQARLNRLTASILADHQRYEGLIREGFPTPLASSLYEGCVARGLDLVEGGATFNSSGIQAVGVTDVADSLLALEQVVFVGRRFTLEQVIRAMEADFEGEDGRRVQEALLAVPKLGHDGSPEPGRWVDRVMGMWVDALAAVPGCPRGGVYSAGYYALNVNIVYGEKTPALPSGRRAGVPLANSVTPHYGMRQVDLLSALNAVAAVDFRAHAPNGATVTFTIDAGLFPGEPGERNLAGVVRGFFQQGGMQFQPNVVSRQMLLDAWAHPEKYPFLLVRVAGYCAYFNDLSDELKRVIVERTCYS